MSLIASAKNGNSLSPLEAGAYPAVCYGMVDLGEQYSEVYKKAQPKILIMWEIPGETFEDAEGNTQSRVISQTYTNSLGDKATLRRDLASWRGRDFTETELSRFDLRSILGAPCLLNVIRKESNGKTYANIATIMRLPKGMEKPEGRIEKLSFDLDSDDLAYLAKLPEWVVNRIKQSETYKERVAGQGNAHGDEEIASEAQEFVDELSDDGDLPF